MALAFTRSLLAKALAAVLLGFRILYVALPWVGVFLKIQPGDIFLILGLLVVISSLIACSIRGASGPLEVLLAGHSQHHDLCPQAPIRHSPCGPGIRHLWSPWVILEMLIMIPVRSRETGRPMR